MYVCVHHLPGYDVRVAALINYHASYIVTPDNYAYACTVRKIKKEVIRTIRIQLHRSDYNYDAVRKIKKEVICTIRMQLYMSGNDAWTHYKLYKIRCFNAINVR